MPLKPWDWMAGEAGTGAEPAEAPGREAHSSSLSFPTENEDTALPALSGLAFVTTPTSPFPAGQAAVLSRVLGCRISGLMRGGSPHPPEPGWVRKSGQPGRIDKGTLTKQLTCKLMERKVGLRCKC